MGTKQILQNLSWEMLASLPPTELLALIAIGAVLIYALYWLGSFVASFLG